MTETVVFVLGERLRSCQGPLQRAGFAAQIFVTAKDFFERPGGDDPACLLLSDDLPDARGMDVLAGLAARGSTIPVIVVAERGELRAAVDAVTAGALDYMEQPLDEQVLVERISHGAARHRASLGMRIAKADALDKVNRLTARERQVMEVMVAGRSSKGIAHDLGISERTVEVHRGRVMRKLEVDSVAQLVRIALRAGLVREDGSLANQESQASEPLRD